MVLPTKAHSVGIGDWEMTHGSGWFSLGEVVLYPHGAQRLLELLSPYLAPITEALAPLLAARGLSTGAALSEILAIEGLAESIVDAAAVAVARVDAVGLFPVEVRVHQVVIDELSAGGQSESSRASALRELAVESAPRTQSSATLPEGWQLHIDSGPRYLKTDTNGDPCYPDLPAFEEYWPKCPVPEPPEDPIDVPCLEDSRFLRAEARLRELRHFDRVPRDFRGFNYREKLEQSVSSEFDELYRCGDNPRSAGLMASWWDLQGPLSSSSTTASSISPPAGTCSG